MTLCIDYLRKIEQQNGWSRFRISKELGISSQRVYQLFDTGGTYDDETAFKVAKVLGIDPAPVMASAHAERSKNPEIQAVWAALLEKISLGFDSLMSRANPHRIRLSV